MAAASISSRRPSSMSLPGHDAWVIGDEPAVLIEVDYEADTIARLGLAAEHTH